MKVFVKYVEEEMLEISDKFLPLAECEDATMNPDYMHLRNDFLKFLDRNYGPRGWLKVEGVCSEELFSNEWV